MPDKILSAFHLSFNGNCKEAMLFYQKCFDGDLEIQLVEDAPCSEDLPDWMKKCVMQAILRTPGFTLIGTDLHTDESRIPGNNLSIYLSLLSAEDFFYLAEQLSDNKRVPDDTISTARNGKKAYIKDQFGVHWMLMQYTPETFRLYS